MSTGLQTTDRMIHIVNNGRQYDILQHTLDVGDMSTDNEVKTAVAVHLDVPVEKFRNYTVGREPNGNMTLRPEAVFGL